MSRDRKWARPIAQEFLIFQAQMHNRGISIAEIATVFTRFDEEEPGDDEDFVERTITELLA